MSALYIVPGAPASPDPNRPMGRTPETDAPPQPSIDLDDDEADDCPAIVVTFFHGFSATTKTEQLVALDELARRIEETTSTEKASLPWLKCARFGDIRTDKASLRHDANLIAVTGIEADYDGEEISFETACDVMRRSGVGSIVYTSPSHTEDTPRWRVLCALSEEHPPNQRDRFMGRLNGLLGGVFSRESWTLSQSFYYGSVNGSPSHRVAVLAGKPIDQAAELDSIAIGRPVKPEAATRPAYPAADPSKITDKRVNGKIESLLDNIRNAADGAKHFTLWDNALAIGGYLALTNWTDEQAVEECIAALPSAKDWNLARRTAAEAVAKGRLKPLHLEERPNPRQRRDTDPDGGGDPSSPPPDDGPPPEWENARPPAEGDVAVPADPLLTEQTVMEAFIAGFHTDLRFNHSSGSWLIWNSHHWKPDGRKLAFSWALKLCKQLARGIAAKGRLVVEKVRFSAAVEQGARAMPPFATAQEDWDNDPWLLGTPGGVVDLKTGVLRPGKRSDMITMTTACTPADTEDCPLWLQFLDDAMQGDKAMIGFLQRYLGYCLTGLTMEEIIVFLFGPGGAGKGTVVKTITGIMGDYAITAPMEAFTSQAFRPSEYYRADMAGKRLIVAAETEQGAYWAEAFVKEITGGDRLSGRHPAGRPFTFDPTHKPLLHGNHMPKLRGRSTAMERRLRIALFNHKPAVPDLALKEKLRAEWPGILRWMINGCLVWHRDGLQPPPAIADANKNYFDAQDVLGRWIEDCCILDRNLQEAPATLRTSFNRWAKESDLEEMTANAFGEMLNLFEGAPLKRTKDRDGKRWIRGIGLQVTPEQQSQQRRRQGERDE